MEIINEELFNKLLNEAAGFSPEGWDFDIIEKRMVYGHLEWDYREKVISNFDKIKTLIDLGTGGGELLKSFAPLPPNTFATEGYAPNIPVAKKNLKDVGVTVVPVAGDDIDLNPDNALPLT